MYVRYRRSCSWMCLRPRLCWAAPSVSNHCHSRMLDLGLQLDLPVSGGLVEDDHHARSREDGIFRHLVAVTVHVTFVYRCCHTFYSCAPLHIYHEWRSPWLAGPNSARVVFSQMLEIINDWWSLYARHTVAKLGLVRLTSLSSMGVCYFWQASDSVCTTVLTVTLSKKIAQSAVVTCGTSCEILKLLH